MRKRLMLLATLVVLCSTTVRAGWPLIWDFEGGQDDPVAAQWGPGGDLWLLSSARPLGISAMIAVLLRVDPQGAVLWATPDLQMLSPLAMALRPDGATLVLARSLQGMRITEFAADGHITWSRTRNDLANDPIFHTGRHSAPIWDEANAVWRIPTGIGQAFAILSYSASGDPLPDFLWLPPAGAGSAHSVLPRADKGLLVSGSVAESTNPAPPPRWWTVAFDATGAELWRDVEDGGTHGTNFSGPTLISPDPVRIWADDENNGGTFSLLLWSLDATTGEKNWVARWPQPTIPFDSNQFTPDSVVVADDRILASGVARLRNTSFNGDATLLSFDASDGSFVWARTFAGPRIAVATAMDASGGHSVLAASLAANIAPYPLWLAAWDRDGEACSTPVEIVSGKINTVLDSRDGGHLIVSGDTHDILVQRVEDSCGVVFADGFDPAAQQKPKPIIGPSINVGDNDRMEPVSLSDIEGPDLSPG